MIKIKQNVVKNVKELIVKHPLQNNEGVIFVTVLVIIIVSSLLAISIYSLNSSQSMLAEEEFRRVQAEILADGEHIRYMGSRISPTPYSLVDYTLNSVSFSTSLTTTPNAGVLGTDSLSIEISF